LKFFSKTISQLKDFPGVFMKLYSVLLFLPLIFVYAQGDYQEDFQKIKSRYNYEIFRPSVVDFNYFVDYDEAGGDQIFHFAVSIQNDFLQFRKDGDKFISRYETSLIIRKDDATWFSKSWKWGAVLSDFDVTNSKHLYQYQSVAVKFKDAGGKNLQDGEYEVFLEVTDKFSSRDYKNKRKLNYSGGAANQKVYHTEITFLQGELSDTLSGLNITATRNIIDINRPYFALASVFGPSAQNIEINTRIYKTDKEQKSLFFQDNNEFESDSLGKCTIKYPLPYKKMTEGKYSIRFSITAADTSYEIERDFSVLWFLKPLYLFKVDLAVRPLKYLISPEEMEKVKNYDLPELTKWFTDFWKGRDPDTTTVFNELQEVYYTRVSEAVRLYSTRFQEGWQTDRGMVFLLYGEPSEVENRKYSVNSLPHIIWKYNYPDNVRQFVFVDKMKTGDFVLVDNEE
jgi:GWxTD domain-containing protein